MQRYFIIVLLSLFALSACTTPVEIPDTYYDLTVTFSAEGGAVSSTEGLSCDSSCTESVLEGTTLSLTATPAAGYSFSGWRGACTGATCSVTVSSATELSAVFNKLPEPAEDPLQPVTPAEPGEPDAPADPNALELDLTLTGRGTVYAAPLDASCDSSCTLSVAPNNQVVLTATPATGFQFAGWTDTCSTSSDSSCTLSVGESLGVSVVFEPLVSSLSVTKMGTGGGTVTSNPATVNPNTGDSATINCGDTCSLTLGQDAVVSLIALPDEDSVFVAWSGDCTGSECTLDMTVSKTVSAIFDAKPAYYSLSVTKSGSGAGLVSSPDGINCGGVCSLTLSEGTRVTLTASPGASSSFTTWTGACTGSSATCTVTVDQAHTVTAVFDTQAAPLATIIDGYTDAQSYEQNSAQTVYLNAETPLAGARVDLFDILGNVVDSVTFNAQPQQITNAQPWQNGFGYSPSFTYNTGALKSGVYLWANRIPFIVKDSSNSSLVRVVYPSNTTNAYTCSGGKSTYTCGSNIAPVGKATKVSFLRPMWIDDHLTVRATGERIVREPGGKSLGFFWWLENDPSSLNTDYGVLADIDLDDYASISGAKVLVFPGHSEYWTRQARENVDAFVAAGGHVVYLSGGTMWWQVRYEDNGDTMVIYRSTRDPISDPGLKTIMWNDPSLNYSTFSSTGGGFNLGGFSNYPGIPSSAPQSWNGYKLTSPDSPLFEGTGMSEGDILAFDYWGKGEHDGAPLLGFDTQGYPRVNTEQLGYYKFELLGFDQGYLVGFGTNGPTIGTFMAFQTTASSGKTVNVAYNAWAYAIVNSTQASRIQQVSKNIMHKLLYDQEIFSTKVLINP